MSEALHVWELDDGEQWWLVAATEADARRFALDYEIGVDLDDGEDVGCKAMPDDEPFGVAHYEDDLQEAIEAEALPEGYVVDRAKKYPRVVATCGAWARSSKPGCVICSTVGD